jgi:hypothetical protein
MSRAALLTSFMVAVLAVGAVAALDPAATQGTFADTRAIIEFQRAADRYAFLHRQVERRLGLEHRPAGGGEVGERELAEAIVEARRSAAIALFASADIVDAFRNIAARALRAPDCNPGELRTGAWELSYQVNSPATGTRPLSSCIAAALPDLPPELEYRSAGTVLVVVDGHANLVVDVLPALLAGSDLR